MDDSQDIVIVVFGLEKVLISYFSCFTCCQGITFLDSRLLESKSSGQFCFNSLATSGLVVRFCFSLLVWNTSVGVYPADIVFSMYF